MKQILQVGIALILLELLIIPTFIFYTTIENGKNCMQIYTISGATEGFIYKLGSNTHIDYKELPLEKIGTVKGCIVKTGNIGYDLSNSYRCYFYKYILN